MITWQNEMLSGWERFTIPWSDRWCCTERYEATMSAASISMRHYLRTNNELGFDYLRDNMVIYKEQLVQRDLHYCIIDEVDSVLIDEARTPLIISGQSGKSTKLYEACDILAQQLERGEASHEMTKMACHHGRGSYRDRRLSL